MARNEYYYNCDGVRDTMVDYLNDVGLPRREINFFKGHMGRCPPCYKIYDRLIKRREEIERKIEDRELMEKLRDSLIQTISYTPKK